MQAREQNFDLQIVRAGSLYKAYVLESPAGEADGEFNLPFSDDEIAELFRGLGQLRTIARGTAAPVVTNAKEFGAQLFDRVFSGNVRDCLRASRGSAGHSHALRIRLRLTKV